MFSWYQGNSRDLPWRKTSNPYNIWVSEIMLQQTQVSRVIEYYTRFLEKYPTIENLAKSDWEEMLPYWRGLGFYSRGKNMLKAAKYIMENHKGFFPDDIETLQKIPGIGPYTSAAIASFAYKKSEPALDTNLLRVFQRIFGCTEKGVAPRAKEIFLNAGKQAYNLNHAFMDLGSEICKGRKVDCENCPLSSECFFLESGKKEEWEKSLITTRAGKVKKSNKMLIEVAVGCIHQNGKYLIAKRPKSKGGSWEFPGGKREKGEDWRHCMKRELEEELGIEVSVRPHFFEEMWEEKDVQWRVRFFRCQILKGTPETREHKEVKWVDPEELLRYNFPSANKKAIEKMRKMRFPGR